MEAEPCHSAAGACAAITRPRSPRFWNVRPSQPRAVTYDLAKDRHHRLDPPVSSLNPHGRAAPTSQAQPPPPRAHPFWQRKSPLSRIPRADWPLLPAQVTPRHGRAASESAIPGGQPALCGISAEAAGRSLLRGFSPPGPSRVTSARGLPPSSSGPLEEGGVCKQLGVPSSSLVSV